MGKLTKRSIEALAPREIDYIAWDNDVPGFGVRVMPSGRKSFVLQYRAGRRSRRMVLGYVNVVTPEQARTMASVTSLRRDRRWPSGRRRRGNGEGLGRAVRCRAHRGAPEAIDAEGVPAKPEEVHPPLLRQAADRRGEPRGGRPLPSQVPGVPYQANRCLEILSKMFNLAELWGLRPDGSNPRKHIKKYREEKRERFLSAAELRRVGEVLDEMQAEGAGDVVSDRRGAAAYSHRLPSERDHDAEVELRRPTRRDAKPAGLQDRSQGRSHRQASGGCPAPHPALLGNPWVITGKLPGSRLSDLQPFWQRLRARAGLKDARIHDLRHTFASAAVAAGQGLPMIGKLLGHTQVGTTARYAHLAADPVKAAAEQVSGVLASAIGS